MKRVVRIFLHFPAVFVVWSVFSVFVLKYIPVQWTPLMLKREIQFADDPNYRRVQEWISLSEISRDALSVIILSEDSRFWQHKGADVKELVYMIRAYRRGDAQLRGCSTISQQVAKNCFTFCFRGFSNTYFRHFIYAFHRYTTSCSNGFSYKLDHITKWSSNSI